MLMSTFGTGFGTQPRATRVPSRARHADVLWQLVYTDAKGNRQNHTIRGGSQSGHAAVIERCGGRVIRISRVIK